MRDSCSRGHVIGGRIVMHTDNTNVISLGRRAGKGQVLWATDSPGLSWHVGGASHSFPNLGSGNRILFKPSTVQ